MVIFNRSFFHHFWQDQEINFSEKQTLFSVHTSNFVFYLFRNDSKDLLKVVTKKKLNGKSDIAKCQD